MNVGRRRPHCGPRVEGVSLDDVKASFADSVLEVSVPLPTRQADIMTTEPRVCAPDTNLAAAVDDGKLVGVDTDRDMYIARATMKQRRIRRLPVEGFGGTVLGIISMNDILLATGPNGSVGEEEIVDTLQTICAHHHPLPQVVAA